MSYLGFDYFSGIIVTEIKKSPWMETGQVFDYAATKFDTYPAVIVTADTLQGAFADTTRNIYNLNFLIYVLMSRMGQEQQTEVVMRGLVDDIIQRLNNNPTINGKQSTFGKPISVTWGYGKAPEPDMRVASLKLNIEVGQ